MHRNNNAGNTLVIWKTGYLFSCGGDVRLRRDFEESFVEFRFAVIVKRSEMLLHHRLPHPALSVEVRNISNSC
jgi:hypothetical protein